MRACDGVVVLVDDEVGAVCMAGVVFVEGGEGREREEGGGGDDVFGQLVAESGKVVCDLDVSCLDGRGGRLLWLFGLFNNRSLLIDYLDLLRGGR